MHNYHAGIELKPTASSGTVIHWYGTYETSWLLGWVMPRYLQKFMQAMAEGLARHAEESEPARLLREKPSEENEGRTGH